MMPAQHCELRFPIMLAPWCPVMLRDLDGGEHLPVPRVPLNFAAGPASITGIRILYLLDSTNAAGASKYSRRWVVILKCRFVLLAPEAGRRWRPIMPRNDFGD